MNKATLYHFNITRGEWIFIFEMMPGTPWQEIFDSLDEFKKNFQELKDQAIKDEEAKKQGVENA